VPEAKATLQTSSRLFSNPDFRRLWAIGLGISVVRWLEMLALALFAYRFTASPFVVVMLTMLRMVPMGKIGEPNDIGYMILYLASDESKFTTGAEMVVDGGCTAM